MSSFDAQLSVYNFQQMTCWNIFLFFPENSFWRFMQIVSTWDNLHEMSEPVS